MLEWNEIQSRHSGLGDRNNAEMPLLELSLKQRPRWLCLLPLCASVTAAKDAERNRLDRPARAPGMNSSRFHMTT